ncbi:MAG TPA: DUF5668 domain-containing protein [Acidisarcina sp.]
MNQWLQLRRLRAPAFLVLLGVMFLLAEWHIVGFHRSWPLLLILAGILSLAERAALTRVDPGQFGGGMPGTYAGYPPPAYPPQAYPPPGYSAPGSVVTPAPNSTELTTNDPTNSHIVADSSDQGRS